MLLRVSSLSSPTEWLPLCDDVSLVEVVAMVVVLDFFCRVTGFIRTEKKEEEDEEKEQKERKKKNRGADESVYDSQKLVDCCDNGI